MSEKRGILVLPVQLAPLDPEEHQEKTDPKATLLVSADQWHFIAFLLLGQLVL